MCTAAAAAAAASAAAAAAAAAVAAGKKTAGPITGPGDILTKNFIVPIQGYLIKAKPKFE
jgi:hypothetical protein